MDVSVGSIFKYHNHVIRVVKKTADTIVGEPYFVDKRIGNLQFNIPIEKVGEIDIVEIATKNSIQEKLKNIAEEKNETGEVFVLDTDQPISQFTLEQAIIAIKGLVDEKEREKDNFSANKNYKLKELMLAVSKEIGIAYNIDLPEASNMLAKSIDKRIKAK